MFTASSQANVMYVARYQSQIWALESVQDSTLDPQKSQKEQHVLQDVQICNRCPVHRLVLN